MNSSDISHYIFSELVGNSIAVPPGPDNLEFFSSQDFAALSLKQSWLVNDLVVQNEPLLIGGPKKCMKTSMLLELAVSLAAGINNRFLQKFVVPRPYKVGVISGESGKLTIRNKTKAICNAKGLEFEDLQIEWCFRMPLLTDDRVHERLSAFVRDSKLEVMIFDPLYLGLMDNKNPANTTNVLHMGPLLQRVVDICLPHGCTPILVHHTRKLGRETACRPLDLDDLSQSGFAEFARQWMLLSRREEYLDGSGKHELWMRTGGSAGHSALWSVGIDEGQACYDQNQTKWAVKVSSANEIFQAKEAKKQEQEQDRLMHDVRDIQNYLDKHPEGDTRTGIREALGCSGTNLAGPLKRAIELQLVVEGPIVKGGRRMRGYRLSEYASSPTPDNPDNPDGQPDPP